jgi:glycosyltransferase involved in cell wall biosynthesis
MRISVVIPLFNEEESLNPLFEKISEVMNQNSYSFEVIFIDDGSNDNSLEVLNRLQQSNPNEVKIISFGRNYGKSAALSVGIEDAQGEIIITMDSDLQDDPIEIPKMVKLLEEKWDVVSGWKKKRHDPVFTKNIPSKLFNFVVSRMSGVKLHDFNCGFKAYKQSAAKSLEIYGERHRFLPALAHWNGYRVTEMPVTHHARQFGVSKFGIDRFLNGFFDLATLLFLRKYLSSPLHFFGLVGLFLVFVGLSIMGYFGIEWINTGSMHLRPLILLAVTSTIIGVQIFSIGLIGELVISLKDKREYHIKEKVNSNVK